MLAPKRILHRKVQRGSMKGQAKGNTELHFGEFGIQALEAHWITNRQIEAARIAMNIDLPRKVRYNARKVKCHLKVDKACRIGRTYDDFKSYLLEHPDLAVTQLDSVEGKKGSKVLLTIHFLKAELMLAFLRDHNDSQSVIDIFERLFFELRPDRFRCSWQR